MLGEKLFEASGQITGMRVLPGDDHRYVKIEQTFQASGTLLGKPCTILGTIEAFERVPGQLYVTGQGLIESDGVGVMWNGHGVGTMTGEGMAGTIRYSIALQAGPGPLERLNHVLVVGEFSADADGKTTDVAWEWK
ncbi:MAG: hypothetical protein O3C25_01560 [Chloroflexi bacterium]|nr:hypothetical protein [Chloroflexota bacterium]